MRDSPALQERLAAGWAREADTLVAAVAEATGADAAGDPAPKATRRRNRSPAR